MIFWVALFDRKGWHGHSEIASLIMALIDMFILHSRNIRFFKAL